jgi:hypothetical protein
VDSRRSSSGLQKCTEGVDRHRTGKIYKEWTMHINPATTSPVAALAARVTPSAVSAGILQQANGDGDGKTGAAALNDGDTAARAAAQQVRSASHGVDVKA